jgi:hypothetical protein
MLHARTLRPTRRQQRACYTNGRLQSSSCAVSKVFYRGQMKAKEEHCG